MMASKLIKNQQFVDGESQTEAEEVNFLELISELETLRETVEAVRKENQLYEVRCKRFEDKVDAYTVEKERLYDKYKKTTHELHDVTRELNGLREEFALTNKCTKDLEKRVRFGFESVLLTSLSNFSVVVRSEGLGPAG